MEVSDGTRDSQGRTGQEGQAQEGSEALDPCDCGQTRGWHELNNTRHKFTPKGQAIDTRQFDRKRTRERREGDSPSRRVLSAQGAAERGVLRPVSSPFDPVLRMALIDAGIITVEQLQEAEKKIAVFTQQVTQTGLVYRGGENADA